MELTALGWDDDVAARYATVAPAAAVPGRVARVDRGAALVLTPEAELRAALGDEPVATGDWVAVDDRRSVVAVAPRTSAVVRRDPGQAAAPQLLVANLDVLFVVHGLDRPLNVRRIERELVVAFDSGAEPVVVLTKTDCCTDVPGAARAVAAAAPGVPVHSVNARSGDGVDALLAYARPCRTVALLGPSGAGKSTLTNRMSGEERQRTRDVRGTDAKGRHTTTARHLVVLPDGGVLVDTPGLRALALWDAEEGLEAAFPDVVARAAGCRFGDCAHEAEPGCAVRAAVEDGELPAARYDSYRTLRRELDDLAVERALRARLDRRRADRRR